MLLTKTSPHAEWRVARLYYHDPIIPFLVKALKPFVDGLGRIKISDRYYWKRSEENGRHIQLFLRCPTDVMEILVMPNLVTHFSNYIDLKPSTRVKSSEEFLPDNSMYFHDYEPNMTEWGGAVGLPIAERFFHASSNIVLYQLSKKGEFLNAEEILETAIILHLGFLKNSHSNPKEIITFYENLLLSYSGESFSVHEFETFFEKQSTYLRYFIESAWNALNDEKIFTDDNYNRWIEDCYFVVKDLKDTYTLRTKTHIAQLSELWFLYGSLLRFVNNQLGIKGKDEALLFYILLRSFESI